MSERLSDEVDLEQWPAPRAPDDFEDRVMARVDAELRARPVVRWRSRRAVLGAVGVVAVAAGVFAVVQHERAPTGSIHAETKADVVIGQHVTVNVVPGTDLSWRAGVVTQTSGDAFYRVDRGALLKVSTPVGDVEVHGTCFRIRLEKSMGVKAKATAAGAALGALAMIVVYEGRVVLAHGGEHLTMDGGDAVVVGESGGIRRMTSAREAESALDDGRASGSTVMVANADLVSQVRDYRSRLDHISEQKAAIEKELDAVTRKLRAEDGGAAYSANAAYDLSTDDWKELAKTGSLKFRTPCAIKGGWDPSPGELGRLGLAPDDAIALRDAYARSHSRVWGEIRPLCAEILSAAAADKLRVNGCASAIIAVHQTEKHGALAEAMRQVSAMRAGLRPMPASGGSVDPIAQVFLTRTGELRRLEADIAQSLGPAEAHRIVYSEDACAWNETWPGDKD